jgi:hypothetical protein
MDWNAINNKLNNSKTKYSFYFGDYEYQDYSKGKVARKIPKQQVGWGRRAVEIRANKTNFDRFENDTLGLNEIFTKYKVKEAFNKVKDDVLVCGCGFLALNGNRVFPFTAEEATGTFSWFEQNLKDGVALFRQSTHKDRFLKADAKRPDAFVEYLSDRTIAHERVGNEMTTTIALNGTGRPLMGLLTHKATAKRPFGQSVLTKAARSAIVDASRTIRQAMIAAYHYNTKVDVIMGADSDTAVDKIESQTGDVLKIGPNENGQIPQIGEFAQHAMAPFTDTILTAARNFCSDTKLSLVNLGISSDAPQSTEALEIINDDLRDDILSWQKELAEQLKYFAVTLWMYENNVGYIDQNIMDKIEATKPVFLSVYRQDVSKFGDGLVKIAQQAPDIVKSRTMWRNLGLTSEEIDDVIASAGQANNIML